MIPWLRSLFSGASPPAPTPAVTAAAAASAPPASTGRRASVSFAASGRPTYAQSLGGFSTLGRSESFELLEQFHRNIPLVQRAVDILAGFVGVPELIVEGDDAASADLQTWAESVQYGQVGRGLQPWIRDHLGQTLLFGFGVGEFVANAQRADVERLWSYKSPAFGFRSDAEGALQILQSQAGKGLVALDPTTLIHTARSPRGCDPNGTALFFASNTFCQTWVEIAFAIKATWRRSGIPIYLLNWEPHASFEDPDGSLSSAIKGEMETYWNEGMRSKVMDGQAKDFFSTGKTTVSIIGADGQIIPIDISKRAIVEELVTASGLPAWMFGYTWSTTERLSDNQADLLLATIDCLRSEVTGGIRKIVDARQRLTGRRNALAYQLVWPDVSLKDLKSTAQAALTEAQAERVRQQTGRQLWTDGVFDQLQYAEYAVCAEEVAVPMDEPPAAPAADPNAVPDPNANAHLGPAARKAMLAELAAEYPTLGRCGGH